MTEAGNDDFVHIGPGTLAGRYLQSYWQPVHHAKDIAAGRALPIHILGEDFTLYRGESGEPHLVDFRCAHRGTQLSVGWVEGDEMRCFYHGWKYDAQGQCVQQPAEPEPFCHKIKIGGYPVREYPGLICAYLGEGEPPEFPRYSDFEDFEGLLEDASYTRHCSYFQHIENFLDDVHLGFIHRNQQGAFDGRFVSASIEAEETGWGMTCRASLPDGRLGVTQLGMPNVMRLKGLSLTPIQFNHRDYLAWWLPIDDDSYTQFIASAVRAPARNVSLYIEYRDAFFAKRTRPREDLGEAILAGELALEDITRKPPIRCGSRTTSPKSAKAASPTGRTNGAAGAMPA